MLTPILLCVYPDRYSVYNSISEEGLTILGRNPIKDSDPFSKRYRALNDVCHRISSEIRRPLYLIDSMFSLIVHGSDSPLATLEEPTGCFQPMPQQGTADGGPGESSREAFGGVDGKSLFSLETQLQEFIVSNWNSTPLGKTLEIHVEDEERAIEFSTGVGEIDILARDCVTRDWVVIELKKGRSDDTVVGQILRYMGWIRKNKAKQGEKVRGIIITGGMSEKIRYAISAIDDIQFFNYKLSFDLIEVEKVS